ncbi:hypothetical protein PR048_006463 [Dryococelus australis]|uniref:Mutator-like transposase domain-containing protein n=1 Tax=Dryococelus australis TaxID=614101 RepID=A0ABQ9IB30_9NEOP|nr:hypothetical protein PR048_006463 [Dryococelus australis]
MLSALADWVISSSRERKRAAEQSGMHQSPTPLSNVDPSQARSLVLQVWGTTPSVILVANFLGCGSGLMPLLYLAWPVVFAAAHYLASQHLLNVTGLRGFPSMKMRGSRSHLSLQGEERSDLLPHDWRGSCQTGGQLKVRGAGMKGRGKQRIPEKNPPTNGIIRHDFHLRKSGDLAGNTEDIQSDSEVPTDSQMKDSDYPLADMKTLSPLEYLEIYENLQSKYEAQYQCSDTENNENNNNKEMLQTGNGNETTADIDFHIKSDDLVPSQEAKEESFSETSDERLASHTNNNQKPTNQGEKLDGRWIVDIKYFLNSIMSLCCYEPFNCSFKDMELVDERQLGFCSVLSFKCKMCHISETIRTEPPSKYATTVNVNASAVSGMIATGGGYSQLEEICASLNMPYISRNK